MALETNRAEAGVDGSTRKAHYGEGKQPWDTILELGWGPAFAAGSIIKYLRRTKNEEHSLESAQWYYNQMLNHAAGECNARIVPWMNAIHYLEEELTREERVKLRIPLTVKPIIPMETKE